MVVIPNECDASSRMRTSALEGSSLSAHRNSSSSKHAWEARGDDVCYSRFWFYRIQVARRHKLLQNCAASGGEATPAGADKEGIQCFYSDLFAVLCKLERSSALPCDDIMVFERMKQSSTCIITSHQNCARQHTLPLQSPTSRGTILGCFVPLY